MGQFSTVHGMKTRFMALELIGGMTENCFMASGTRIICTGMVSISTQMVCNSMDNIKTTKKKVTVNISGKMVVFTMVGGGKVSNTGWESTKLLNREINN